MARGRVSFVDSGHFDRRWPSSSVILPHVLHPDYVMPSSPGLNLVDRTNIFFGRDAPTGLLTPPSERKRAQQRGFDPRGHKRLKLDLAEGTEASVDTDSESEDDRVNLRGRRAYQFSIHSLRNRAMLGGPSSISRQMPGELFPQTHQIFCLTQISFNKVHLAVIRLF